MALTKEEILAALARGTLGAAAKELRVTAAELLQLARQHGITAEALGTHVHARLDSLIATVGAEAVRGVAAVMEEFAGLLNAKAAEAELPAAERAVDKIEAISARVRARRGAWPDEPRGRTPTAPLGVPVVTAPAPVSPPAPSAPASDAPLAQPVSSPAPPAGAAADAPAAAAPAGGGATGAPTTDPPPIAGAGGT